MKKKSDNRTEKQSGRKAGSDRKRGAQAAPLEEVLDAVLNLGSPESAEPSGEVLERCGAIPMLFDAVEPSRTAGGELTYDSWSAAPACELRDIGDGHVRRLRFEAGSFTVEVVAEKRQHRWEFTARVYRGSEVAHDFVLKIGGRRLLAGPGGFFFWSSRQAPRVLELLSYERQIRFQKISW